jgi:hypothetical protein
MRLVSPVRDVNVLNKLGDTQLVLTGQVLQLDVLQLHTVAYLIQATVLQQVVNAVPIL